jgi:DNA-binding transcriptional LysR family regulator
MLGTEIDLLIAPELTPSKYILRTERTVWIGASSSTVHKREPMPVALLPQGSFFRDIALTALDSANVPWYPAFVCTSLATMMAIVTAGLAIGVCPESLVHAPLKRLQDKRLAALPGVYITLRDAGERMSRAAKVLHEFLIAATVHR